MFDVDLLGWVVLTVAAFLIGISKTALPGAGTLVVALFAAVLPARQSTAAMLLLLLMGDLIAVWTYRHDADWRVLKNLVPTVLVGIVLGAIFLLYVNDAVMKKAIAIILLCLIGLTLTMRSPMWKRMFAANNESSTKVSVTANPLIRGAYGALGGFTTMAANAGGPVMSLYFLAARFEVVKFLGTSAWFFFVVNLLKVPFSAGIGLITSQTLLSTLVLAPIVILGAVAGRFFALRMTNRIFDPIVLVLTVVSSVALLF
ncbi:sulfite exporter TauE/SafE family protein [Actinomycetaceae bacterium WB03_NA08]|uniref:Probable membrane transporter protein n=1 Tax=Scrofimicrobium canadense TaxID=2652290 RepID=A0A6N7VS43_9ACTO|nr:sulfite exporter TauE/SafE family protein [Scrofimicrobium canadense]MSS84609.1 sulfite exporter TauE/SafE family protein [Scrofimicrobium canadense]